MDSDQEQPADDVTVLKADKTLFNKLGGANLDEILSPEKIKKAETVIREASGDFYSECVVDAAKLKTLVGQVERRDGNLQSKIKKIVDVAFGIKNKAAQSGYNLIAALAKSLHVRCEALAEQPLNQAEIKIIAWHSESIERLLNLKIEGDGGDVGQAILGELKKIERAP